jgi:16S rRNA (uracil1498-N3)-methyltransferase
MRFLVDAATTGTLNVGDEIILSPERSHYLCKVMRARRGERIDCFDGQGRTLQAILVNASSKQACLRLETVAEPAPAPTTNIHLGISLLKGQAMDRALQQATELGASAITLLNAKRSNVQLSPERADNKMSHWQKIVISACEQCGRLYLPALQAPMNIMDFLDGVMVDTDLELLVFDQHGERLPGTLPRKKRVALIGPEGGWDDSERALFKAREVVSYSLGPTVLRAETVPAVALALLEHVQHQESGKSARRSSI